MITLRSPYPHQIHDINRTAIDANCPLTVSLSTSIFILHKNPRKTVHFGGINKRSLNKSTFIGFYSDTNNLLNSSAFYPEYRFIFCHSSSSSFGQSVMELKRHLFTHLSAPNTEREKNLPKIK